MALPVIAVLGATGSQGGSVVAALLKQNKFLVRAVTRNAAKAGDLANKQNVEIAEADMGDKASLVKVCLIGQRIVQPYRSCLHQPLWLLSAVSEWLCTWQCHMPERM